MSEIYSSSWVIWKRVPAFRGGVIATCTLLRNVASWRSKRFVREARIGCVLIVERLLNNPGGRTRHNEVSQSVQEPGSNSGTRLGEFEDGAASAGPARTQVHNE